MFEGQGRQLKILAILLALCVWMAPSDLVTRNWFFAALFAAALHHAWVTVWWRLELHLKWVSRNLGHPRGFYIYASGFVLLAAVRVAAVFGVAAVDSDKLGVGTVGLSLGAVLLVLFVWLLVSVRLYFGMQRAFGLDHWEPERFRDTPLVRRGIHALTPNAMYTFAPTVLFAPALLFDSPAALVVARFNTAYLWTHYFCTEKPDMARIS